VTFILTSGNICDCPAVWLFVLIGLVKDEYGHVVLDNADFGVMYLCVDGLCTMVDDCSGCWEGVTYSCVVALFRCWLDVLSTVVRLYINVPLWCAEGGGVGISVPSSFTSITVGVILVDGLPVETEIKRTRRCTADMSVHSDLYIVLFSLNQCIFDTECPEDLLA